MGWDYLPDTEALEALYGTPSLAATIKVADHLTPEYRAWVEAARFCALATSGPEGLDCSPRGDDGPVLTVLDPRHIALPDRRGNNRIDSLRNIQRDGRVALMCLYPGSGTVIRINGQARITADADALARFEMRGALPRSLVVIAVEEVYFQCARAVMRAGLWSGAEAPLTDLPSVGQLLDSMSKGEIVGADYDAAWPARAEKNMW
ncbi:pyridoxamine 5'-phosphate oxidase family protein [Rhodobacteraceae bacterium KN286]|uniref:Pyridoxamine 5'-phosphate oxidase family protein n=1 Tax=Oceanomicrobium pacificus TaxID=2692916 RepID=A0A6B0TSJ0_9RHOB|nr:pyridoxamine 5'-phosphate oxidase family protein [Oceanomicrobium pacificus]